MMNELVEWFGRADKTALAAFVLSLAACIGSAVAWRKSHNVQKRQVAMEEKRERDRLIEKKKARLLAEIVREDVVRGTHAGTAHRLSITNKGQAEARDIKLTIDGKPILEHPAIPHRVLQEFHILGPGSSAQFPVAVTRATHLPWQVEVDWTDDSGEPGHYRTIVT